MRRLLGNLQYEDQEHVNNKEIKLLVFLNNCTHQTWTLDTAGPSLLSDDTDCTSQNLRNYYSLCCNQLDVGSHPSGLGVSDSIP